MSSSAQKPWEHAKAGEGSGADPLAARFVESLSFDTRLYDADIRGSIAHARMLAKVGLISSADLGAIERGLDQIKREIESAPAGPNAVGVTGAWPGWKVDLEDVHMCIEAALVEKSGDAGRRLHTGRSRNDQVALDLRIWLRDACRDAARAIDDLLAALKSLARVQGEVVMPSYTHLQRAQPIVLGAELFAWHAMLARDRRMFLDMPEIEDGLAASPLGAGAIAGSSLALDRAATAESLGFDRPGASSIDATASRDEALDFLYALTRTALHLSRLAEQWIIYSTSEFGFLSLGGAYTTGSSMMPQKRNPDMLELMRGKSGTIAGHFAAMLMIVKGLPIGYNRDLQEDKRHVFTAYDTLIDCVRMAGRVVASARFDGERIGATIGRGHLDATALAEYLVGKGIPFRTAHQIVGSLVRVCESSGREALSKLTLEEVRATVKEHKVEAKIDKDLFDHLGPANVVKRYRSGGHGGPGPEGYRAWAFGADEAGAKTGGGVSGAGDATRASLFAGNGTPGKNATQAQDFGPLLEAYERVGRTLDDLPYTEDFERIYSAGLYTLPGASKREVFHRLHNLRKAGKLPRVGRSESMPVRLEAREEGWLRQRVEQIAGSLGQRDQLPYDARFDALVESFNQHTGRSLSPHDVWRLVAKLAK